MNATEHSGYILEEEMCRMWEEKRKDSQMKDAYVGQLVYAVNDDFDKPAVEVARIDKITTKQIRLGGTEEGCNHTPLAFKCRTIFPADNYGVEFFASPEEAVDAWKTKITKKVAVLRQKADTLEALLSNDVYSPASLLQ